MNQFLEFISDIKVVIAIAVIILILLIWLIIQRVKTKRLRDELSELESHYKLIKNIPVSMKMNKAAALSRLDPDAVATVNAAQADFDRVQSDIVRITESLSDAEDHINAGKLGKADRLMTDLETELNATESYAKNLESTLDAILARETTQRQEVTQLKNKFRALKAQAQENATRLAFAWPIVEQKVTDTEKMFSTFEEWMFSNDYDKANNELEHIRASIDELEQLLDTMPGLIEDARGIIPKMAENLHRDYARARKQGVYLKHLEAQKNLSTMTVALKDDLKQLKSGNTEGIREHLDDYKQRINQMDHEIKKETQADYELTKIVSETEEMAAEANRNAKFVNDAYAKYSDRYGLASIAETLTEKNVQLNKINEQIPQLLNEAAEGNAPASETLSALKTLNRQLVSCAADISEIRQRIEMSTGDEDRAKKQLVKLQIIMNQMQVKIRKYKLPNISAAYEQDMEKASGYISRLEELMAETPLNIQLMNSTLQEALNFIYQLYNNVNNVVGTVVMVENTIVFGNRYRSTYADIDSELTRSELSFRNGEYTNALTTAIATIEKIHPGNYESMIKENAKSAA
ncbi:MAG: septation ring formation regulator EzrA [Erysipelotrichaceae bacterium]|nr:septation ring formation regulator EzrA [Erysipelotrichaceae bacterium]